MSNDTPTVHVIVTLSPESIAALAEALRPRVGRRTVFVGTSAVEPVVGISDAGIMRRALYAREATTEPWEDGVARVLKGRASATTSEVLDGLGVPPERQDRAWATRVGTALLALGWRKTSRRGGGTRERVYTPPPPVVG